MAATGKGDVEGPPSISPPPVSKGRCALGKHGPRRRQPRQAAPSPAVGASWRACARRSLRTGRI